MFHHRSDQKSGQKRFKGKSKGKLKRANKGKVERTPIKSRALKMLNRKDRVERRRQIQKNKRKELLREKRFGSRNGPPRVIGIVALNQFVDYDSISRFLGAACDPSTPSHEFKAPSGVAVQSARHLTSYSFSLHRESLNAQVYLCPRERLAVLDIAKVADLMMFVTTPEPLQQQQQQQQQQASEPTSMSSAGSSGGWGQDIEVDALGLEYVKMVMAQGVPCVVPVVQGMHQMPIKVRRKLKNACSAFFNQAFAGGVVGGGSKGGARVLSLPWGPLQDGSSEPLSQQQVHADMVYRELFRTWKHSSTRRVKWREGRARMLAHLTAFLPDDGSGGQQGGGDQNTEPRGTLACVGYLRGKRCLNAKLMVHLTGYGDFSVRGVSLLPALTAQQRAQRKPGGRSAGGGGGGDVSMQEAKEPASGEFLGVAESHAWGSPTGKTECLDGGSGLREETSQPGAGGQPLGWDDGVERTFGLDDEDGRGFTGFDWEQPEGKGGGGAGESGAGPESSGGDGLVKKATASDLRKIWDAYLAEGSEDEDSGDELEITALMQQAAIERSGDGLGEGKESSAMQDGLGGAGGVFGPSSNVFGQSTQGSGQFMEDEQDGATGVSRDREMLKAVQRAEREQKDGDDGEQLLEDQLPDDPELRHLALGKEQAAAKERDLVCPWRRFQLEHGDQEFPDEIEYHPDLQLRTRLSKYRGVKSFRLTEWDTRLDLPPAYERIFLFKDFKGCRKLAQNGLDVDFVSKLKQSVYARDPTVFSHLVEPNGAQPVILYLAGVPASVARAVTQQSGPVVCSGLLPHERKVSVLQFMVRRTAPAGDPSDPTEYSDPLQPQPGQRVTPDLPASDTDLPRPFPFPIRSGERMQIHCGFRRFSSRPVYSRVFARCDKTMLARWFPKGSFVMASCYARVQYPPAPVLMFYEDARGVLAAQRAVSGEYLVRKNLRSYEGGKYVQQDTYLGRSGGLAIDPPFVATGVLHSVNPDHVVLKRAVLSGVPVNIFKRGCTCKDLFFHPSDARWFRKIDLWTKRGLRGHMLEAQGTKGHFKALFDSFMKSDDAICMSMYKRQFPKWDADAFIGTN